MKKITSLLLSLLLICSLSAQVFAANDQKTEYSSMTASEFVKNITIGWNLGNTLDALDGDGLSTETGWGNPKTTKAMIKAVKSKGFNTVRIPVSWGNHMDENGKIDKEWLDRVQTVVDYAYSQDMFVIINSHHDRSWIKLDTKSEKAVTKKYKYLWKQIAVRFKKYDEHLIFESMNEPITESSDNEWSGGTSSERQVLNRLNKAFADTVRASGGKNATRFIMIPPYGASAVYTSMAELEIPDDHTIVSVHAYAPNSISLNLDPKMKKFTDRGKSEIDAVFSDIKKAYISKGIPVIIGEFGTMNKDNTAERVKAAKYYLQKASACGIPCIWWDNGINEYDGTSETFGLLDRSSLNWYYPDIVNALISSAPKGTSSASDPSASSSAPSKTVKIGKRSYKTSMSGTLNLSSQKLDNSDIADLRYMTNLSELILSNNELTDLSALSGLTQLEKLTFHNNNVTDLSFTKNMTNLKVIGADNNGITNISALSKLTKLEEIWLSGNNITDISHLKSCVNVTKLALSDDPISDISSLSGMKNLKELQLGSCRIKSIKALNGCTKLETVYIYNNRLSDLKPLAGCKKLNHLEAQNNKLNGDLKAIKGLTILSYLDISGNGYNDPDSLYEYVCTELYSDDDGFSYYY